MLKRKVNLFIIIRACTTRFEIKKKRAKEKLINFTEDVIFRVLTPIIRK